MNLKEKLLFLFIPLIILPLVFITVAAFFLFRQISDPILSQLYVSPALIFIVLVVLATTGMIVAVSHSISHPLKMLTHDTLKIAKGDLEATLDLEDGTKEVNELVSAINQMKSELKRQQELIREEAAHVAIGKLASHVAHDLASPLASLQTALEHFRNQKEPDPKTANCTNLLELSSKRLRGISKELLDYLKGEEPKQILFSLHKLLDELIGEYQSQETFRGVEFTKKYISQSLFIFGDRAKIQRVFGNLMKNAIEAMDKCGSLLITTEVKGSHVTIAIEDNGCGMTPEVLAKVLSEGATHGKEDGHGIGLRVVQKTIDEHKGKLSVHSEMCVGTTFSVSLPLPESGQFREAEREEDFIETFTLETESQGPIMVIDDDLIFLEQWRLALEKAGKTLILYTSYEDFELQKIAGFSTTAIVDYHFDNSELNGIQIIEKLREQGFKNLYLCTAEYWKPLLKKQAVELGVTICPKPLPAIVIARKSEGYTVLVIDDDESIRLSWEVIQNKLHIEKLFSFPNLEALLQAPIDLKKIDIAFVDKNIRESEHSGGAVVDYLKAHGVAKVVLASGENEEELRNDPAFAQADFISGDKIPRSFKEFFS